MGKPLEAHGNDRTGHQKGRLSRDDYAEGQTR